MGTSPPSIVLCCALTVAPLVLRADDCNANGADDAADIGTGRSADCNQNGVPDECDLRASRGFDVRRELPTGLAPVDLLARDLEGDGDVDLVTANQQTPFGLQTNSVSVVLNAGDRQFAPRVDHQVHFTPGFPLAADLNGDGRLDLELVHVDWGGRDFHGRISILFNVGQASYRSAVSRDVGTRPTCLASGDLDGDERIDLALGHATGDGELLLNVDAGAGAYTSVPLVLPAAVRLVSCADLNGDANLDLAFAVDPTGEGRSGGLVALEGSDGTSFRPLSSTPIGYQPSSQTVVDLDVDGNLDLAIAHEGSGNVTVLRNRADGSFVASTPFGGTGRLAGLTAGDLDGDGLPDLAVLDRAVAAIVLLPNAGEAKLSPPFSYPTRPFPGDLALEDLDGDGHLDVAATSIDDDTVSMYWGDGTGQLQAARRAGQDVSGDAMATGDLDGDGLPEIVLGGGPPSLVGGRMTFIRNAGDGRLAAPSHLSTPAYVSSPLCVDLDGDSWLDLLGCEPEGDAVVRFASRGEGRFAAGAAVTLRPAPLHAAASDLDRDGDMDVAVVHESPALPARVDLLLNDGAGALAIGEPGEVGPNPGGITAADLDGDGDADVAVTGSTLRALWLLANRGDASFDEARERRVGVDPRAVLATDLTGDGRLDLATVNNDSQDVSVLLGSGGGEFEAEERIAAGDEPRSLAARDLDGDGRPDLVVANEKSHDVSILIGDGAGRFPVELRSTVGRQPVAVAAVDLDADGDVDGITLNQASGDISLLVRQPAAAASSDCNANGVPDECDAAGGDFTDRDGNGILDACEPRPFHRGDANVDGSIDISDAIFILGFLFVEPLLPACLDAVDTDDSGTLEITDAISLLGYLFSDGPAPAPPGPAGAPCGLDAGDATTSPSLGCASYDRC